MGGIAWREESEWKEKIVVLKIIYPSPKSGQNGNKERWVRRGGTKCSSTILNLYMGDITYEQAVRGLFTAGTSDILRVS